MRTRGRGRKETKERGREKGKEGGWKESREGGVGDRERGHSRVQDGSKGCPRGGWRRLTLEEIGARGAVVGVGKAGCGRVLNEPRESGVTSGGKRTSQHPMNTRRRRRARHMPCVGRRKAEQSKSSRPKNQAEVKNVHHCELLGEAAVEVGCVEVAGDVGPEDVNRSKHQQNIKIASPRHRKGIRRAWWLRIAGLEDVNRSREQIASPNRHPITTGHWEGVHPTSRAGDFGLRNT